MKKAKNLLIKLSLLLIILSNGFVLAAGDEPATTASSTTTTTSSTAHTTTTMAPPATATAASLPVRTIRIGEGLGSLLPTIHHMRTELLPSEQTPQLAQQRESENRQLEAIAQEIQQIKERQATFHAQQMELGGRHGTMLEETNQQITLTGEKLEQMRVGLATLTQAGSERQEQLLRELETIKGQMAAMQVALDAKITTECSGIRTQMETGFSALTTRMTQGFEAIEDQMKALGVTQEEFVSCGMALTMVAAEHIPIVGHLSPTRLISLKSHPFILLSLISVFEGPEFLSKCFPRLKNNFVISHFTTWLANTGIAKWHQRTKKALRMAAVAKIIIWAANNSGGLLGAIKKNRLGLKSLTTSGAVAAEAGLKSITASPTTLGIISRANILS